MTKEEAIKAMSEGKKVRHRYFDSKEWVTLENGMIVSEDGVKMKPWHFWGIRKGGLAWEDDWELFKE